jgi:hypothetical protein
MYAYVKYIILIVGLLAAIIGICNLEIAPAIVSVGAFVSYALIETRDLKTLNDDKE